MINTTLQKLRAKLKLSKRADDQAATGSKLLQDGQTAGNRGSCSSGSGEGKAPEHTAEVGLSRDPQKDDAALFATLTTFHKQERLRAGSYAKRLLTKRHVLEVTCFSCKKHFSSHRGFELHSAKTRHYPVPEENAEFHEEAGADVGVVEVVVGSKVKLCDDELYVASGEVVSLAETGKHVHNVIVKHDEVVIQVKTVDKPTLTHPLYKYSVEVGSFTAWKLADLEVIG